MTTRKTERRFAICIQSDDMDLLTPRTIYEVLPDESASRSDYVRVIDDEGEDYLYPAENFIFVDFPSAVHKALLQASQHGRHARKTKSKGRSGTINRRRVKQGAAS